MIWRLPIFVVFWIVRLAIFLPLAIMGIPLVYWQTSRGKHSPRPSKRFSHTLLLWSTWFMWPWQNEEDGVDGLRGGDPAQQWWADKTAGWSPQKRIFVWSALRNPVDSLRWVPVLNPQLIPREVHFIGMDHEPEKGEGGWYFAWMGPYSCIRYETKHFRFWFGWKIRPEDRCGLQPGDVRAIRCDFAMQAKRVARG